MYGAGRSCVADRTSNYIYIYILSSFSADFLKNSLFSEEIKQILLDLSRISQNQSKSVQNTCDFTRFRRNQTVTEDFQGISCPTCPGGTAKRENAPRLPEIYPATPFFVVLSFSVLSLIQYKKFDIIYLES